jgi:putative redox protein
MAVTSKLQYLGTLRIEAEHIKSGKTFITDAPTDNQGKGEAFSPTDILATSLGACMITVMGIRAVEEGFDLENCTATVQKVMAANPRRISEVHVEVSLKANCSSKMQKIIEGIGRNCPVAKSLHPDLKQVITINWL